MQPTHHNGSDIGNTVGGGLSRSGPPPRRAAVDVLLITAVKEEHDAVRAALGHAGRWQEHDAEGPSPYSTARYRAPAGATISVALARPTRMGGRGTHTIATTLTNHLRPTCLAMTGVCAGNPATTAPGDVVVAAPAYQYDEGKYVGDVFLADPQQFLLDARWLRAAQDFDPWSLPSHGVATDQEAAVWFLERLLKEHDPRTHPARRRYFPRFTWSQRLEQLSGEGLIIRQGAGWALTPTGRAFIQRRLYDDVDGPDRLPFAVHAGPMASGNAVRADPEVWTSLGVAQRKIVAIEMEAATIATVAHECQVPHWLIAKGVMDHADPDKDDRFKAFAARASAEVLFALIAGLLSPGGGSTDPGRPVIAVPPSVKREVLRRLTYDWQDLADVVGVSSAEARRFRTGDESRDLWEWLDDRRRLGDLPDALHEIGRVDLADLLRPYLAGSGS
jgi:nucleoside phosphorylase